MMQGRHADEFNWRAPHFLFDVERGALSSEEMRRRTVSLSITDNAREYDTIEWTLMNDDGMLTRTENLALGLLVRVRYGYNDFTTTWRSFIISRAKGGVGVHKSTSKTRPAVHSGGAVITLSGRNRNAPDNKIRRGKKWGKRAPRPGNSGRTFHRRSRGSPSSSITQLDSLKKDGWTSPTDAERILRVTRVSDAVREIAYRMGYTSQQVRIEDTEDVVNSVVIPMGMTYIEFLDLLAEEKGWVVKAEGPVFKFHSERWAQGTKKLKHVFTYGGPDIIDLTLDADLRLPDPRKVTTKAHNPIVRRTAAASVTSADVGVQQVAEAVWIDDTRGRQHRNASVRDLNLRRDEVSYVTGGAQYTASHKARLRYEQKSIRSMRISVTLVGNPYVKASDEVDLRGTGCQLVDRVWYIHSAQHIFDGTTYITKIDLRAPSKRTKKGRDSVFRLSVKDKGSDKVGEAAWIGNDRLAAIASGKDPKASAGTIKRAQQLLDTGKSL